MLKRVIQRHSYAAMGLQRFQITGCAKFNRNSHWQLTWRPIKYQQHCAPLLPVIWVYWTPMPALKLRHASKSAPGIPEWKFLTRVSTFTRIWNHQKLFRCGDFLPAHFVHVHRFIFAGNERSFIDYERDLFKVIQITCFVSNKVDDLLLVIYI